MGLDMYLYAEKFFHRFERQSLEEKQRFDGITELTGFSQYSEDTPHLHVSACVAYWSKSNAIHAWILEECGAQDDCGRVFIERSQLESLVEVCSLALNHRERAPELLPTKEGFFFGSTEYDECYFQDLEETVKMLTEVLKSYPGGPQVNFYYQASW